MAAGPTPRNVDPVSGQLQMYIGLGAGVSGLLTLAADGTVHAWDVAAGHGDEPPPGEAELLALDRAVTAAFGYGSPFRAAPRLGGRSGHRAQHRHAEGPAPDRDGRDLDLAVVRDAAEAAAADRRRQ